MSETDDDYSLERHFRMLADRLSIRAVSERAPAQRAELKRLAGCYCELAAQQLAVTHFQR